MSYLNIYLVPNSLPKFPRCPPTNSFSFLSTTLEGAFYQLCETRPFRTPFVFCPLFAKLHSPGSFPSAASAIANPFQLHKILKTIRLLKSALASFQWLLKVFTLEKVQSYTCISLLCVNSPLLSMFLKEESPFLWPLWLGRQSTSRRWRRQLNLEVSYK